MNASNCKICGSSDKLSFLMDREDHEYGVKDKLKYYQCTNKLCLHVYASPIPSPNIIASFYKDYTTHEIYQPNGLGHIINFVSEKIIKTQLHFLKIYGYSPDSTHILDFGCGNGNNLKRLSILGYKNIVGFDFDPNAVECVKEQGFTCYSKIDQISNGNLYDIVFLNHVIEHLSNPVSSICQILELIRPGGLLVIRTPNSRSLMAKICGNYWRGWETPRHLNIFTYSSLKCLFKYVPKATIVEARTSNSMSHSIAISSMPKSINKFKPIKYTISIILIFFSIIVKFFNKYSGEELVFKIKKDLL